MIFKKIRFTANKKRLDSLTTRLAKGEKLSLEEYQEANLLSQLLLIESK